MWVTRGYMGVEQGGTGVSGEVIMVPGRVLGRIGVTTCGLPGGTWGWNREVLGYQGDYYGGIREGAWNTMDISWEWY